MNSKKIKNQDGQDCLDIQDFNPSCLSHPSQKSQFRQSGFRTMIGVICVIGLISGILFNFAHHIYYRLNVHFSPGNLRKESPELSSLCEGMYGFLRYVGAKTPKQSPGISAIGEIASVTAERHGWVPSQRAQGCKDLQDVNLLILKSRPS